MYERGSVVMVAIANTILIQVSHNHLVKIILYEALCNIDGWNETQRAKRIMHS